MTPQAIPLPAWEQAAIVVLFGVFFLAILGAVWKIVKELRPVISETNKSFQEFITKRDEQWQDYLTNLRTDDHKAAKDREDAFNTRNAGIVEALKLLTERIDGMIKSDALHHQSMVDAIKDMHERTQARRRQSG